jgi:tripartite-type tricarboxylate transporter receptor subunit TctC
MSAYDARVRHPGRHRIAENHWENTYMPAAEARKRLDQEYAETKQILIELGMAK